MNLRQTGLACTALTVLTVFSMVGSKPAAASCSADDGYMGSICMMAGDYCPVNHEKANGQLLTIAQNAALFAILGTRYGGDGRTSFALPDLRGRTPVGVGTGTGLTPVYPGKGFGSEYSVLTNQDQLPSHTHGATFSASGGGSGGSDVKIKVMTTDGSGTLSSPENGSMLAASPNTKGSTPAQIYASATASANPGPTATLGGVSGGGGGASGGTVTIASTGAGKPFEVMPPRQPVTFCIVTNGLFPMKP